MFDQVTCVRRVQQYSEFKTHIFDQKFYNLSKNAFETAEFCCVVSLAAISLLLQGKQNHSYLICSFYCCLMKGG